MMLPLRISFHHGKAQAESGDDKKGSNSKNDKKKLLAKKSRKKTTAEKTSEKTIVRLLSSSGSVLSDWIVVVVVALVADRSGCFHRSLWGAIAVLCNNRSLGSSVGVLLNRRSLRRSVFVLNRGCSRSTISVASRSSCWYRSRRSSVRVSSWSC